MAGNIPAIGGYSPEQLAQMAQYLNAMQTTNPYAANAVYNGYNQPQADTVSFSGGQEPQPQTQKKGMSGFIKLALVATAGFLAYKYIPAVNKFCKEMFAKLGFGKKATDEAANAAKKKVGTVFSDSTPGLSAKTKEIKNSAIADEAKYWGSKAEEAARKKVLPNAKNSAFK